jgi:hypothetical protein
MIHKRQFIIGNNLKPIKEDWEFLKVGEDLYLSHCPTLPIGKRKDLNDVEWLLLGIAIQTDKEKDDPLTQIGGSLTNDINELYKSWTGRWILIGNNEIHLDCCGLLGCFYMKTHENRWISSSLAVLQEIGCLSPRPESIKHASGIEWYPLPTSRFEGVYKLLPSQILNLTTFRPEKRALPKPIQGLSYDQILDQITEKLRCALLHVSNSGLRIIVALTAGYDSRLVLAACCYAGIKVKTFIRVHETTSYSDIILSKKLSKASGISHRYIKSSRFSKENEDVFNRHTAGNTDHIVRKAFSNRQYDLFTKEDIILAGTIFDVAKKNGYRKNMDSNLSIETIFKALGLEYNSQSYNFNALTEWVEWVKQTPTDELDWRDRFYLEQRIAGWASSIQQALDLIDAERLLIANSYDLVSLFLSIPEEKRKNCEYHVDLIRKMFPTLLRYPFNPRAPIWLRLQKKVVRIAKMPFSAIYKKLRNLNWSLKNNN